MFTEVRPFADFAVMLKALMGDRTTTALADLAGVSQSAISKALSGRPLPDVAVKRLAKAFRLDSAMQAAFYELAASARARSYRSVREYIMKVERERRDMESQLLKIARALLKRRKDIPEDIIEMAQAIIDGLGGGESPP
jgi:transcriptional regulator with XRE-family HTH domain